MRGEASRCGLDAVLDVIGGKWKTLILWELDPRPRRFGELRRRVEGVSEKVLIQQLRDLETVGIVHREQYNEVPPRVEYSLTDFGRSLTDALAPLCEWGERNMERIERCQVGATSVVGEAAVTRVRRASSSRWS